MTCNCEHSIAGELIKQVGVNEELTHQAAIETRQAAHASYQHEPRCSPRFVIR